MPPLMSIGIERGEEIGVRMHNQIMRAVLHSVAQNHLVENVRRHFEDNPSTAPGGAYGYHRRSDRWLAIKKNIYGDQPANVASGRLRSSILGGSRITATKDRSRIYLKANRPLPDWQREEMEAMTAGELRSSMQLAVRLYVDEYKSRTKRGARTRKTI